MGFDPARLHAFARHAAFAAVCAALLLFSLPRGAHAQAIPCDPEPTNMVIEYGQNVACDIGVVGDIDQFRFHAEAGHLIRFQVVRRTNVFASPCVELYGPDGVRTHSGCGSNAITTQVAQATGIYVALVYDQGNNDTFGYTVTYERLWPVPPTATPLTYSENVQDRVEVVGDLDLFAFNGVANQKVRLQVVRRSNVFATACLTLRDPDGVEIHAGCGGAAITTRVLPKTGIYLAVVNDQGLDDTFEYTVTLERLWPAPRSARVLTYAENVEDSVEAVGDLDLFAFTGIAGQIVRLQVVRRSNVFATPCLVLFEPDGEEAHSGCGGGGITTRRLEKTGTYIAMVHDQGLDDAFAYTVTLERLSPPSAAARLLEYGVNTQDSIEVVGDLDLFMFSGVQGDTVRLQVVRRSNVFATACVDWLDPESVVIHSGCGGNAITTRVLARTGTYVAMIYDQGLNDAFAYTVTLERMHPASPYARQLTYGETAQDSIEAVGDLDFFVFTGVTGDTVRVQVARGSNVFATACLDVYDPGGTQVHTGCGGGATMTGVLQRTGAYTAMVYDQGFDDVFAYTMTLVCVSGACPPEPPPPPPPLPPPPPPQPDFPRPPFTNGGFQTTLESENARKPSLDGLGRYVAFVSEAGNLVLDDTNGVDDIFVRDRITGAVVRVSVSSTGLQADGPSDDPVISESGRWVVFSSTATNLVPGDTNGVSDIFIHDRDVDENGVFDEPGRTETRRVSVSTSGGEGDGPSVAPDLSPDGAYVAFASEATNLVPDDTNAVSDVFRHHWPSGMTRRVSMSMAGMQGNAASRNPAVSRHGTRVAFTSLATNLVGATGPALPGGAGAAVVAPSTLGGCTDGRSDVFVWNGSSGSTTCVSQAPGGGAANGDSDNPSISDDGLRIAFDSTAENLVAGDTNGRADVFVWDEATGQNVRVSENTGGGPANGDSTNPAIAGDGASVAFASTADDLVAGDTNGVSDVFVTPVHPVDTQRVSLGLSNEQAGTASTSAAINTDGQFVAFESGAVLGNPNLPANQRAVFVRAPTFFVTGLSPRSGLIAGGAVLSLTGVGFAGGITASFGGQSAGVVRLSETLLSVTVPARATAGAVDVDVVNGDGLATRLPGGFTYLRETPTSVVDPDFDSDGDGLPDLWEIAMGLDPHDATGDNGPDGDPDGDGLTNAEELARGTHPRGQFVRYVAEGASGLTAGFQTTFALANPGLTRAHVLLRFQRQDGAVVARGLDLAPMTSATVDIAGTPELSDSGFSTVVESSADLVFDRTMLWDRHGFSAHAESGLRAPSTRWYLAEGATHSGFGLFYLLQNPSLTDTAHVRVRYLRPVGPPLEAVHVVPANTRYTIWVNQEVFAGQPLLAATDVSAVLDVLNGVPIIVERAMYLDAHGRAFMAGHASAGVTEASPRWFLAEGATGPYFDMFVLVANPNPQPVQVRVTYLLPDSTTLTNVHAVPAESRHTIWVNREEFPGRPGEHPLAEAAVSVTVEAIGGASLIVERAMWWPSGNWFEAHNSPGAVVTGTRWALAGGLVGGPRETQTYVLVANTSPFAGEVRVSLLFEDATPPLVRTFPVGANSRFNVDVGDAFPETQGSPLGRAFGVLVESLGDAPAQIVVERAVYWDALGMRWVAGTNALGTRLQ